MSTPNYDKKHTFGTSSRKLKTDILNSLITICIRRLLMKECYRLRFVLAHNNHNVMSTWAYIYDYDKLL